MAATPETLECRPIGIDEALFESAVDLRDRVLREPIGRPSARHDRERDSRGVHFAAVDGGRVVGCLALYPDDAGAALLKSLAVAPEMRRTGVGVAVYRCAETWARAHSVNEICADARIDALPFYGACGFSAEGEDYMVHGVPHRKVRKFLRTCAP